MAESPEDSYNEAMKLQLMTDAMYALELQTEELDGNLSLELQLALFKSYNNGVDQSESESESDSENERDVTFHATGSGANLDSPPDKDENFKGHVKKMIKCLELVREERVPTAEKAEIVVGLVEMGFEEKRAVSMASRCNSIEDAILFLTSMKECGLCTEKYEHTEMVTMLHCTHYCCTECAKKYFTDCIREKNIRDAVCPFCQEPKLLDTESMHQYFSNMSHVLKSVLESDCYELFQTKLLNVTLDSDPAVWYCPKCGYCCYIDNVGGKQITCRRCRNGFCMECKVEWENLHNGISCLDFAKRKTNENLTVTLNNYLDENGIDCPECKSRFALSKGGCMHFRCPKCKHEFCCGCQRPFKQGNDCKVSENCQNLGLHAHHPRNCLFYLRDCDIKDLQSILKENNIEFKSSEGINNENIKCEIMEQKETQDGLIDEICGKPTIDGDSKLCMLHHNEYLVNLMAKNNVDPLEIMRLEEITSELQRNGILVPEKQETESDDQYKTRLINLVKEEIPLDASNV